MYPIHISVSKFLLSYYSNYVEHKNIALKAPTQKMPSAFQVSRKSFKAPTQFHEIAVPLNILINPKSLDHIKVESFCLEVLWSIFTKTFFRYANCNSSSNANLNKIQFQAMALS